MGALNEGKPGGGGGELRMSYTKGENEVGMTGPKPF